MYHKVRITVVSLVVMAICVLSSTGTLSYFTDTDAATNNFVVGNASTVLAIYNDAAGDDEHVFDAGDYTLTNNMGNIPFYLQAANDGNIPVYQRFRVVIPIALRSVVTLNLPTMDESCVIVTDSENTCSNADYTVKYKPSVNVGETPTYAEYYIVSKNVLDVDGVTREWPTLGIQIGNIASVDNYETLLTCVDGSGNNCVLGIGAYSDAIQTTGFDNALEAFDDAGETY